jgi:hypothetical protein
MTPIPRWSYIRDQRRLPYFVLQRIHRSAERRRSHGHPTEREDHRFLPRLGDSTFHDLARDHGVVSEFEHALVAIQAGQIGPQFEADPDALDALGARAMGGSDYI